MKNPPQPPRSTLVMKFGGTSVGNAGAIAQAVEIVKQANRTWERLVVVTSAMSGVTNQLLGSAEKAVEGDSEFVHHAARQIRQQHEQAIAALVPDLARQVQLKQEINYLIIEFTNLCQAIAVLGEATPRARDAVASLGERLCVRLLAAALESQGVPAQYVEATQLIVTDRQFEAGHPDIQATQEKTRSVLEPMLSAGRVPVVTGFIAATPEGVTITLGRGGSDYSAALLGAVLPADEVWIWTDVDGVMTADPRWVPEAHTIPELSYREIAELAYYGAKVVHPKTIRPVIEAGISLRVCNTFNPSHPGTCLVAERSTASNGGIKAVSAIHEQSLVTIEGRGMLGVPGVAARTFSAVASTGTSVPLITQASSEQSITFSVPLTAVEEVVSALERTFINELNKRDIDRIWATGPVTILTVVGAGMRNIPGIAGRVFTALGRENVNVIAIAQGSSEVSISMVVEADDAERGLLALHGLIARL